MKKTFLSSLLLTAAALVGFAQPVSKKAPPLTNTLLWRVSGKDTKKPSYIFGTMHMLCADDIELSDSLKAAIGKADNVYLELQMDNMMEMMGAMMHMKMKADTTLSDLLTPAEYKAVKAQFDKGSSMLPFSMIEDFKPMLTASLLGEQSAPACDHMLAMEQLIMAEAKDADKKIKGLETMDFQLAIFDKIPYKFQAKELYKMVTQASDTTQANELVNLTNAYRQQELSKLEDLTKGEDAGMKSFTDLLLYNRNKDWAKKLQAILPTNSVVVAVGAGHLPGPKGLLALLRNAGYKVEPVKNKMIKKKEKEI